MDDMKQKSRIKKNKTNSIIVNNDYNNYTFKEIIGKGQFSEVRKAVNYKTNRINSVKIYKKINLLNNHNLKKFITNDRNILLNINHKNIIKMDFVIKQMDLQ